MKFQPEFDVVGMTLAISAILIMLYNAILDPLYIQTYFVAFGFWIVGFFGALTLGLTTKSKMLTLNKLVTIAVFTGLILLVFSGFNMVYGHFTSQSALPNQVNSFAIGASEELFFGVFCLGIAINWLHVEPWMAILGTAAVHSYYHVPAWGVNPPLLVLFFGCFAFARTIYVYVFPKVGVLLGAHAIWNLLVAKAQTIIYAVRLILKC